MDAVAIEQGLISELYHQVLMIPIKVKGLWFAVFKSPVRLPGVELAPYPVAGSFQLGMCTNDHSKSPLEEKVFAVIPLVALFTISLW
jgi:hypothetical protein